MRATLLYGLLLGLSPSAHACGVSSPVNAEVRIAIPAGLAFPNGIAAAPDGTLFVGGVADGSIYRRSPKGAWSVLRHGSASADLWSVASLRLNPQTGILWGTSPDVAAVFAGRASRPHRIFAIDTRTGKRILAADTPEGGFANDLALASDGSVYLTDSRLGRIWRFDLGARRFTIHAEHPDWRKGALGPAGIALLPNGDLVIGLVSEGKVVRVTRSDAGTTINPVPLSEPLLRPDGLLAIDDRHILLVEGGTGKLRRLDLLTGALRTVAQGLAGPVNLTRSRNDVLVTESGIEDPATFDLARPPTAAFAIRCIPLAALE